MVSSASMNVFQHKSFPLTEKRPVISAWNAGNAASLTLPRKLAIGLKPIPRWLSPVSKTNDVSHTAPDSALEAQLTSVSGEWI